MKELKTKTNTWYRWLLLVIIGIMFFGLSMLIFPFLIRQFFSLIIYGSSNKIDSNFMPEAVLYISLVHGVLGAVMFGWGVSLLLILMGPFKRETREGWLILAVSVSAWFTTDSIFSLYSGFWQNAVLNLVIALLIAPPLIATYSTYIKNRT